MEDPREAPAPLSRGLLALMSAACGISAANIYYNQPLLGDFARQFGAAQWKAGLVATAAQVGYGAGIFLFLPLGDLMERRRLIIVLIYACAVFLIATGAAPNLPSLIAAQLLVGLTAMSPQILIPFGADLVPAEQRGKLVGALMSGLLTGILLARMLAGFAADHFGWRALYLFSAFLMAVLGFGLKMALPLRRAAIKTTYRHLMRSMFELLRTQPRLREASLVSALSFAAFSALWTTLSFQLADRFHLGASAAGLYGVVGLIGAAGAPGAGRLSDRKGPHFAITAALLLSVASLALMGWWVTLMGIAAGVLLMDLGVQSIQVAAQTQVISLLPEARSRLNTLYMVARFIGGAAGSACGAVAWQKAKWPGVIAFCIGVTSTALAVHLLNRPPRSQPA